MRRGYRSARSIHDRLALIHWSHVLPTLISEAEEKKFVHHGLFWFKEDVMLLVFSSFSLFVCCEVWRTSERCGLTSILSGCGFHVHVHEVECPMRRSRHLSKSKFTTTKEHCHCAPIISYKSITYSPHYLTIYQVYKQIVYTSDSAMTVTFNFSFIVLQTNGS